MSLVALSIGTAAGELVLGDMQLLGYNTKANKPNQFSFVVWTDIAAGEQAHFTDSGFFSDDTLRDTESVVTWTAPTGGVSAGTVIVWTSGTTDPAFSGSLTLTEGADQIFAGDVIFPTASDTTAPGSAYSGTDLIHGFYLGTAWDTTATSDTTSALPSALSGSLDNFLGSNNAGEYTGTRTGTIPELRAAIDNPANWSFSNGSNIDLTSAAHTTSFSIIVPEPSTVLPLAALLGFVLTGVRRRAHE